MTINFASFCERLPLVVPTQFPPHDEPPICEQQAVLEYLGFARSNPDNSRAAAMGAIAVAYLRQFKNWRLSTDSTESSRSRFVAGLALVNDQYVTIAGQVYRHAPKTFKRMLDGKVSLLDADAITRAIREGTREDSDDARAVVPIKVTQSPVTLYEGCLAMLDCLRGRAPDEVVEAHKKQVADLIDDWRARVEEVVPVT